MLLPMKKIRLPFHVNARFLALLIPTQLLCVLLIYSLPFKDGTSWSHSLRKISLGVGWHVGIQVPMLDLTLPMNGAIVAGVIDMAEVQWIKDEFASNWTIHITDVLNTTIHPMNKGHESMVYLNYIVEHFDDLAPLTLFIHGHLESWHQDWNMNETIRTLNLTEVAKEGYVNLRCDWAHGCPDRVYTEKNPENTYIDIKSDSWEEFLVMKGIFEVFQKIFPNEPFPEHLASPCCAQFAVTRESIQRRGKEVFENLQNWLMTTHYNDHISGTIIERLWAYTLRGPDKDTVFCMSPEHCRCRFYGKCAKASENKFKYSGPVGMNPASVRFKVAGLKSEPEPERKPTEYLTGPPE